MLANPRPGQPVQLWYAANKRPVTPLHGEPGVVVAASKGKGPRNHLIDVRGGLVVVPCGNLRRPR